MPITQKTTSNRPIIGGHEKFVFRQSWLKKGLDAVQNNPAIFTQPDAFVLLGVGKNMATSIRYWGLAVGILQESASARGQVEPTAFGNTIFGKNGWDPYLEDIGTLWLIHWQLAHNQKRSLVWYLTFSHYLDVEFRKEQLLEFLEKQFVFRNIQTTPAMIEREADVFLRTYTPAQTKNGINTEESLDCPLVDLNLINLSDKVYRFNVGRKISLPVEIFGYCLIEFLQEKARTRSTATVDECLYQPGSPGQIFKLDMNSILNYLKELEEITYGILSIQDTAGLQQIYLRNLSLETGWNLLRGYYA